MSISLSLGMVGLSGCSSTSNYPDSGLTEQTMSQSNQQLLLTASDSLKSGEFRSAALQLQLLAERPLSEQEKIEYLLLSAELQLADGNPEWVSQYINQIQDLQQFASPEQDRRLGLLKASVLETQQSYLAAARERIFLAPILSEQEWPQNHEKIWQDLMQLPELELLEWAEKSPDTELGGWLQLAAISKNSHLTIDEQLNETNHWRQNNPVHPAALKLPGGLALLADIAAHRPTNVALLLPLSGPLKKTGVAVRDGFMAAYYQSLNKGYDIPTVKIYDSRELTDIDEAYNAALTDGAQWLIGPFNKQTVHTLQQRQNLPLPTLALNYGERQPHIDKQEMKIEQQTANNLYQFGLAAEDEAIQIADRAWNDGHRRALVMMPKGNWGQRIYAAFEQHWRQLGGEIGEQRYYSNRQDYNPEIKALLNVDDSQKRFKTMRRILQESTEFEPRRRHDVDWIFMVALPKQARQIKPTLAFNFAGDLPVYATSHVFSGIINTRKDRDLNGIRFCDVPWLLESSDLHQQLENTLKNGQGAYARLYAMGVDAFRLLPRLRQLEAFPDSQMFGSTGALTLDNQRRIFRKTECTRFVHGKPKRLAENN